MVDAEGPGLDARREMMAERRIRFGPRQSRFTPVSGIVTHRQFGRERLNATEVGDLCVPSRQSVP
jgi:hypothetical protein